jgi:RimJ/RimL family protein N-acetyltransferase
VGRAEPLTPANTDDALAYLARRPYDNVYVQWLLQSGGLARGGYALVWRDDAAAVAGFCFFGPQIVPCADDAAALEAFAAHAAGASARMIVGPRPAVEGFWSHARAALPAPSAIRTSQPVYALERPALRYSRTDAGVGLATAAELDEIVPHSARMIAGEIGGDPTGSSAAFRGRTARIIEARWWWRYRIDGELAFMCNVGSATPHTAQLQGVWTPPPMRGQGHATRALGAICDYLLDEHPTLCLYVNDFNTAAVALYERVGFERAGEFSTIIL